MLLRSLIKYQTVMNKKQSASIIQVGTPKAQSKYTRNLSHTSSSGSIKGNVPVKNRPTVGKQNQSQNIQIQQTQTQASEVSNTMKGLKRIRDKVQKPSAKEGCQKQVKAQQKYKLPISKQQKKPSSQNHSSKSLLSIKNATKVGALNTDKKKTPVKSQKSTPKSIPKKSLNPKQTTKKNQNQISFNIQSQSHLRQPSEPVQIQRELYCQNNPSLQKIQKQEIVPATEISNIQTPLKKGLMIGMFQIRSKLTQGTFSTTFQVVHIQTGFLFCLKVFQKEKIRQQGLQQQIISEIKFRQSVNNKNLQKLFAYFDDQVYVYLIEEYVLGFGAIEKQLQAKRKFSEKESGTIFKQVLEILRFIHSENHIHRDLRLQNLIKCFGIIKMIDFSWIACLRNKKQRDTFCGTYRYAPPQLLQGQNYDESIDIWSLGILLYELCTGQSPFQEGFIKRSSHFMNFPIFLSNELVDLIGRLLSDKGTRMRIQEIMMHQWTNKWDLDGFVCKEIWDFWVL